MRTRVTLLLVLVLALAWTLPALASVARRLSLQELADSSDRVVLAHLETSESAWGPEHRRIYTTSTFSIDEVLAGPESERVVLVLPGGTVGRWSQRALGVPTFEPDEPVVLFLRGEQRLVPVGLNQGVLELDPDTDRFAQRLDGVHFVDDESSPLQLPRAGLKEHVRSLWRADR
jgi:hypothetical protein